MVFLMIPRALIKYIAKRLIFFVITAFAAVTINFLIPRLIPGDPISTILLRMEQQGRIIPRGEELVEIYKRRFGLEGDLFTQYIRYLQRLLQGDLGFSIMAFPMTVQEIIFRALPWTIGLLSIATVLSWVLGNLLGAFLGWVRGGKAAAFITYLALGLNQVPYYFLALVLVFLFAYMIPIFPSQGAFAIGRVPSISIEFVIDVIYHSTLPALSIIIVSLGGWMITMRSMIIEVLGEDYLLLAEAKGLSKNVILMKYAFRNALLPQVTGLAMSLGFIVNGALLTETIFNYPGIGTLFIDALNSSDYNIMQGVFLITTLSVLIANLLIDLLYPLLDPRISYRRE